MASVAVCGSADHPVSKRIQDLKEIYSELSVNTTRVFVAFMTEVAKFEELDDVGKRFLNGFHKETVNLGKCDLQKTSSSANDIIVANWNGHMKAYVEAGYKLHQQTKQSMYSQHTFILGLQDHIKKVEVLLDELTCLMEDAVRVTNAANASASVLLDDSFYEEMMHQSLSSEPIHQDTSISQIITMNVVSNMLKLDYDMQKNIVRSLNIMTTSQLVESYCLVWDLHPYIDDDEMHKAWRLVPSQEGSKVLQ